MTHAAVPPVLPVSAPQPGPEERGGPGTKVRRAPEAALIPIYLQCAPVPHARLAADCSPLTANVANDGRWWEGAAHSCW